MFVPLRSVELERKDPTTVIKAVWQSVPTMEDVPISVCAAAKIPSVRTTHPPLDGFERCWNYSRNSVPVDLDLDLQ